MATQAIFSSTLKFFHAKREGEEEEDMRATRFISLQRSTPISTLSGSGLAEILPTVPFWPVAFL